MKNFIFLAFLLMSTAGFSQIGLPVDFESTTINYEFTNFGGGVLDVIENPDASGLNTSDNVGRMIKNAPEPFGGAFMNLADPIDFSENKIFKMNAWVPAVGTTVLLKVENPDDPNVFFERTATATTAMSWEELTFDFSTIDASSVYQRIVLIFDNGTVGDGTAAFTYYLDDIRLEMGAAADLPDLPLTFEVETLNYDLADFGGNSSSIVVDPTDPTNKVVQTTKPDFAELWAGVTAGGGGLVNAIPFSEGNTKMTVRVWSPDAGIPVRLKAEKFNDPNTSVETEATTTVAMEWETLEFDFNNQADGTAEINFANTYDKVSIFFNFGTTGADAGEKTYFWDDIAFSTSQVDGIVLPVGFESTTLDYAFTNFGGGVLEVIDNPDPSGLNTSSAVVRMTKNAPEPFAGGFFELGEPIDFSDNKIFKMLVWAPAVGTTVLLKVENLDDPNINAEQTATTTTAMAWEELTFDFSAIDASQDYQRMVLIFDNGTVGDGSAAFTYYLDDIRIEMGDAAPRPELPITFEDTELDYGLGDFGGNASSIVVDPTDPNNLVGQATKTDGAELWAGTTIGGAGLETAIPLAPGETKMTVRVWSPDAGTIIRLKVEDDADPTKSVETEATTTVAMAWETLEFDFSNEADGTAEINFDYVFDKISIFFNFGTTGAMAGEKTYYWDDMQLGDLTTGIEVLDAAANGIKVSPNPASSEVNLEFPATLNETATIQLLDMTGRLVRYYEVADQQTQLDLTNITNGIYFLRIESDQKIYVQKLMIGTGN